MLVGYSFFFCRGSYVAVHRNVGILFRSVLHLHLLLRYLCSGMSVGVVSASVLFPGRGRGTVNERWIFFPLLGWL